MEGCPFNCNPHNPKEICDLCYGRGQAGSLEATACRTSVVDLLLGATEGKVLGSLDVERAIKEGRDIAIDAYFADSRSKGPKGGTRTQQNRYRARNDGADRMAKGKDFCRVGSEALSL